MNQGVKRHAIPPAFRKIFYFNNIVVSERIKLLLYVIYHTRGRLVYPNIETFTENQGAAEVCSRFKGFGYPDEILIPIFLSSHLVELLQLLILQFSNSSFTFHFTNFSLNILDSL